MGIGCGFALYLAHCSADDGSNAQVKKIADAQSVWGSARLDTSPALGRVRAKDESEPQALYIVGANKVYVVNIETDAQPSNSTFTLPTKWISTGLVYDDGTRVGQGLNSKPDFSKVRIWFGDDNGNLWALDDHLQKTDGTPVNMRSHDPNNTSAINSTPVIYKDPRGGAIVLFGVTDWSSAPALYGYDPVSHNIGSIPTGATSIDGLAPSVDNGAVYAAGGLKWGVAAGLIPQVFAIRVDELPQALGNFVIESQLMQDPDAKVTGGSTDPNNPVPPSVARYQTHLTVLEGGSDSPHQS